MINYPFYYSYPFGGFGFGSFGGFSAGRNAAFGFGGNPNLQRIDIGGIYVLSTNAVQLTDETVDYGINPCCYNALPCESIVLLKVHADVPAGGEALPVTIVLPTAGRTTLDSTTPAGTASGTTKTPVVDSQGTQIVGEDIEGTTERLAYINKRTGIIRFLEFTSSAAEGA